MKTTTKYPAQLLRQNNEKHVAEEKRKRGKKNPAPRLGPDQKRKTEEADKETNGKKVLHTITTIRRNCFLLFVCFLERKKILHSITTIRRGLICKKEL